MELKDLQSGDWIEYNYGFNRCYWFVLDNDTKNSLLRMGKSRWLVSDAHSLSYDELKLHKWSYAGKGTKRWYWRFLLWRDCVCPFNKPKQLWWL